MKREFFRVLIKHGFARRRAALCAGIFAENTLEGVFSHGVYRFPRFIKMVQRGHVQALAVPQRLVHSGALERWDGQLGPGPLNAIFATRRAMDLARNNGIGCLALGNTNHWMRGGYYGRYAAKKGFIFIGWSNTIANMPAWGAMDCRLGNNPLVIATPCTPGPIVLDMAMTQYSYGKLEKLALEGGRLDVPGGLDRQGNLTNEPVEILESKRPLPIGYWKGAGLALLLDILAAGLSGGSSTLNITRRGDEYGVSQVFIALDPSGLGGPHSLLNTIQEILADYRQSVRVPGDAKIRFPGERAESVRQRHLQDGILVHEKIWSEILML